MHTNLSRLRTRNRASLWSWQRINLRDTSSQDQDRMSKLSCWWLHPAGHILQDEVKTSPCQASSQESSCVFLPRVRPELVLSLVMSTQVFQLNMSALYSPVHVLSNYFCNIKLQSFCIVREFIIWTSARLFQRTRDSGQALHLFMISLPKYLH